MRIELVELVEVRLPLVRPFRTSRGTDTHRHTLLLHVVTDTAEGWGEFGGDPEPLYSPEFVAGASQVVADHLVPRVTALSTASRVAAAMAPVKGHPMAKAMVETAFLDAECRAHGMPLVTYLGGVRDRVPVGVSVGITDTVADLLDAVSSYLEQGYVRIKLKIEPGWDVVPVSAVRREFGDDLALHVDANTAYSLADAEHLRGLDDFGLVQIEQPFNEDDLRGHVELAKLLRTPICLDESIRSAREAAVAITLGACRVVNIKPSRVGGYLEARRVHDACAAHGIPVWCGGMLETGVGRAQNLALAALPGFVLPGDISASSRYFAEDITEPFELDNGCLAVPDKPVTVRPEVLDRYTVSTRKLYERRRHAG
ncbi:o-succinylbenzoate synthase [Kibdelosporangium lantanae]